MNRLNLAEEIYQETLKLFPEDVESLSNLAAIKAQKGLYLQSLILYEKILKIDPYDSTILNNTAWCLEKLNRLDEAISYYYRALAREPENSIFRLNLSECLYKKVISGKLLNILRKLSVQKRKTAKHGKF